MRRLVDDEIAAWTADYQRGLRPYDLADGGVVADRVLRNLVGYGPLEPLLRHNPDPHSRHAQRRHPDPQRRTA